ncbi:solute carrier organic anion transporter family member 1A1-like [Oratosquilla oratoria]|uniref:solute carrier organic anion transporter family member 1A1-like n=1 Tax=Oratosquilla oratoria TaxID=337810 RepID=UPI003F76B5F7
MATLVGTSYISFFFMACAATAAAIASIVGWLGTGFIMSHFKPRSKYVLMYMAFLSAFNLGVHLTQMHLTCDQPKIHGMDFVMSSSGSSKLHAHSPTSSDTHRITDHLQHKVDEHSTSLTERPTETFCMSECHCKTQFSPVCANDKFNFYSACHAGCTKAFRENGSMVLEDCTCAEGLARDLNQTVRSEEAPESVVVQTGYCFQECTLFFVYLALSCLSQMTEASNRVPANLISFRCVEERDKDVGLGISSVGLSLFSFISAPIIVGWAIDKTCILWENKCGKTGFCWLYDLDTYRYVLHGIPVGGMVLCLLTELLLLKWHARIDMYGDLERNAREKMSQGKTEKDDIHEQFVL